MQKPVGAQKAAIILMSLGEEVSAQILKGLSTDEIKKLGAEMTNITGIKKELCEELLLEFTAQFNEDADIHTPGNDFLKNLLPSVLGQDKAADVMTTIELEKEQIPFKCVREIDPRVLANFIKSEHPQTIVIILVHLGQEKASQVLAHLPENLQFEVVQRIAHLETVPPDLVREVDEVLQKELLSVASGTHQILGGVQAVAEILNHSDRRTGDSILQSLEENDTDLAEKVRKLMFVFEDLAGLNDQGVRELLREVKNEELTLGLKTASDDLKNKIFKNLSQRAVQILEEEMSVMGPVRLSDVEAAQQSILNAARKLEKEGKIVLAGKEGGDAFV